MTRVRARSVIRRKIVRRKYRRSTEVGSLETSRASDHYQWSMISRHLSSSPSLLPMARRKASKPLQYRVCRTRRTCCFRISFSLRIVLACSLPRQCFRVPFENGATVPLHLSIVASSVAVYRGKKGRDSHSRRNPNHGNSWVFS